MIWKNWKIIAMQLREPLPWWNKMWALLVESKKDLAYVNKSNALKRKCDECEKYLEHLEVQYSALAEKKRSYSHLFIYLIKLRIFYGQLFLQFIFFVSIVYNGCGGVSVNIRYFTYWESWDKWLFFNKNIIDSSVVCLYCLQWLWISFFEYQILYRNYDHNYCENDVCGSSDI